MSAIQTFAKNEKISFQLIHVEYELLCSLQLWNKKVNYDNDFQQVSQNHIEKLHKYIINANTMNLAFEKEKRRELISTRDVWIPHCSLMLYECLMKGLKHRDEESLTTIFTEMIEEWNVPFQKILLYSPLFSKWKDEYLLQLVKCSQKLLHEIRRQMRTRNFEHLVLEDKIFEWGTLLNKNHEFISTN